MFVITRIVDSFDGACGASPCNQDTTIKIMGYSESKDDCIKWIEENAEAETSTHYNHEVNVSEFAWVDMAYQACGLGSQEVMNDEVYTTYEIVSIDHI